MTLADLSDLRIIAKVDEAQISRIESDQRANISVDTYGDRQFEGKVTRVSKLGVDTSSVITFDVEIAVVDQSADLLRSGMSADIEIVTSEQKNVLLLKADWTSRDPEITEELAKWNRSAVPFNLIYAPGQAEPTVLPELLTPGIVIEALAKAGK